MEFFLLMPVRHASQQTDEVGRFNRFQQSGEHVSVRLWFERCIGSRCPKYPCSLWRARVLRERCGFRCRKYPCSLLAEPLKPGEETTFEVSKGVEFFLSCLSVTPRNRLTKLADSTVFQQVRRTNLFKMPQIPVLFASLRRHCEVAKFGSVWRVLLERTDYRLKTSCGP